MGKTKLAGALLAVSLLTGACSGGGDDAEATATGFQPVRVGASGFSDGAPQPLAAGRVSVSKTADGATFFARVEEAGETDLSEGENTRFRLAGVEVPDDRAGDCLGGTSTTHLRGIIRGAQEVRFVFAEGADPEDEDGIPVHVWSRGIWVNGEVLARGYGRLAGETFDRGENLEAAEEFAREREQGLWNPELCEEEG